jgi:hypothetical protein
MRIKTDCWPLSDDWAGSLRGRMNSKRNDAGAIQWINRKVRMAGSMQS